MKIDITLDDICDGVPGSPTRCPVARGLARSVPGKWCVMGRTAYRDHDGQLRYYCLPEYVRRYVEKFDQGVDGKPFSFDLEV